MIQLGSHKHHIYLVFLSNPVMVFDFTRMHRFGDLMYLQASLRRVKNTITAFVFKKMPNEICSGFDCLHIS